MNAHYLAPLLFLSAPLSAQGVPIQNCLPEWYDNDVTYPNLPGYGDWTDFGRCAAGDFDGDQAADIVFVAGGLALVAPKADHYDVPIPIDVNGMGALMPADIGVLRATQPGQRDKILATLPAGLVAVTMSSEGFVAEVLSSTGFNGAAPLHVSDLDGDGDEDVYAVTASGTAVVWAENQGTGFGSPTTLTFTSALVDVVDLEWPNQTNHVFAALTQAGLVVRPLTGSESLAVAPHTGDPGCLTAVASSSGDWIAWARGTGTGEAELVLLQSGQTQNLGSVEIFDCEAVIMGGSSPLPVLPTAILAEDYFQDDGVEDLLLVHDGDAAFLLKNQYGSPMFSWDSVDDHVVIPLTNGVQTSLNPGIPAFAQLDGYGVLDMAFPLGTFEVVRVFTELQYEDPDEDMPVSAPANPANIPRAESEWESDYSVTHSQFRFAFKRVNTYSDRDNVELILWKELYDDTDPQNPVSTFSAVHHYLLDLDPDDTVKHYYVPLDGMVPEPWDEEYYYFEFRFCNYNASTGVMTGKSPFFNGGFRVKGTGTAPGYYAHLSEQSNFGAFEVTAFEGVSELPPDGERTYVGAYVMLTDGPEFPPGEAPDPGTLNEYGPCFTFTPQ